MTSRVSLGNDCRTTFEHQKKPSTVAVASLNKTITPLVWKLCSGQRNETISAVADKGNATFPVGSSLVWTQRGCSWTGSWCQDTRYKHTMSTGIQEYGINTNTNLNVLESDSNGSFFFFSWATLTRTQTPRSRLHRCYALQLINLHLSKW